MRDCLASEVQFRPLIQHQYYCKRKYQRLNLCHWRLRSLWSLVVTHNLFGFLGILGHNLNCTNSVLILIGKDNRKLLLCLPMAKTNFNKVEEEVTCPKDNRTFLYFKNCKAVRHSEFLNQTDIHPQYLGVTGIELPITFAVWKMSVGKRS